jgi:hypothetical protein
MTMFDEMGVPIHLPIGDLSVGQPDAKELVSEMKPHYHHDEESQYGPRIGMPLPR